MNFFKRVVVSYQALKSVENPIDFVAASKAMHHEMQIMDIVSAIFKFAEQTHETQKPHLCEIAVFNMGDGTKMGDFVSLWAGIGDGNPIKRLDALKKQRDSLKELVNKAHAAGFILSAAEMELINKHFD